MKTFSNRALSLADRLEDYFDLQLRFAERVSTIKGEPLQEVVPTYTNFYRRFGYGRIGSEPIAPEWEGYLEGLIGAPSHVDRVQWTQSHFRRLGIERLAKQRVAFGCFDFEPPTASGMTRIHFEGTDTEGGTGPLSREKVPRRKAELAQMVAHISRNHPAETHIIGASWLYHIPAYRRLFPPDYSNSRKILASPALRFHGQSSWGQFLDHDSNVKSDLRDVFLANLADLDVNRPWQIFPYPVMRVCAPLDTFRRFYGIE